MIGRRKFQIIVFLPLLVGICGRSEATPANRIAFTRYFGTFVAKRFDNCVTCHLPGKKADALQTSLKEFPHNPFGDRLRRAGVELSKYGKKSDIPARLRFIGKEDCDGDGVANEVELLLGHAPGDKTDCPTPAELKTVAAKQADFATFLASYRWQPFEPVQRPAVPEMREKGKGKREKWATNPIDSFLAVEWAKRGLNPRLEASKETLLRRVTIDLIGLNPTPEEVRAFEADKSPNAYEKVVNRLLADPRYGERWARHWMDVWRYSDWAGWSDGNQIRDSKPHIWRWRDWIVESLNKDKGYDQMVQEMIAADELAPTDTDALRATGFLVRNYKMLSREQWMEDTVGHTARAFLGITMQCAKCHDHMYDPISQNDYYRMRAIFEPHNVRTLRVAGELDTAKNGLVQAYDADAKAATYFFPRGDDRNPDKNRPMTPGVPPALGGTLRIEEVKLPRLAYLPDHRDSVLHDVIAASEKAIETARNAKSTAPPDKQEEMALNLAIAEARHVVLLKQLDVEREEDAGRKNTETWTQAAKAANTAQRQLAMLDAQLALLNARLTLKNAQAGMGEPKTHPGRNAGKPQITVEAAQAKVTEAEKAVQKAEEESRKPATTEFKPRSQETYPETSTGRRLAFARWLTETRNPLTARVAVNHIWAHHFGQGLVPSMADFGRNGRAPSHPQLLDWLAAELMQGEKQKAKGENNFSMPNAQRLKPAAGAWSIKHLHRLIVTSRAYRMASTPDAANLKKDPDNVYLWRMNSRRLEAEAVRDNVLYVSGSLDLTRGGPDIDHNLGLTSRRRSLYLRIAAEKEVEFLKIFDGPSVTECYERKPSVMPQQALALANSELARAQAKVLTETLSKRTGSDTIGFIKAAFLQVLSRRPTEEEIRLCSEFLRKQPSPNGAKTVADSDKAKPDPAQKAKANLILVLFNHNDFVTVR